eukprot:scaffold646995_cov38-Prasinocladus_malaysianus.AAC.1
MLPGRRTLGRASRGGGASSERSASNPAGASPVGPEPADAGSSTEDGLSSSRDEILGWDISA